MIRVENMEFNLWGIIYSVQSIIAKSIAPKKSSLFSIGKRSESVGEIDDSQTQFDNRPIIHESPFNLQPRMVLGCKGESYIS